MMASSSSLAYSTDHNPNAPYTTYTIESNDMTSTGPIPGKKRTLLPNPPPRTFFQNHSTTSYTGSGSSGTKGQMTDELEPASPLTALATLTSPEVPIPNTKKDRKSSLAPKKQNARANTPSGKRISPYRASQEIPGQGTISFPPPPTPTAEGDGRELGQQKSQGHRPERKQIQGGDFRLVQFSPLGEMIVSAGGSPKEDFRLVDYSPLDKMMELSAGGLEQAPEPPPGETATGTLGQTSAEAAPCQPLAVEPMGQTLTAPTSQTFASPPAHQLMEELMSRSYMEGLLPEPFVVGPAAQTHAAPASQTFASPPDATFASSSNQGFTAQPASHTFRAEQPGLSMAIDTPPHTLPKPIPNQPIIAPLPSSVYTANRINRPYRPIVHKARIQRHSCGLESPSGPSRVEPQKQKRAAQHPSHALNSKSPNQSHSLVPESSGRSCGAELQTQTFAEQHPAQTDEARSTSQPMTMSQPDPSVIILEPPPKQVMGPPPRPIRDGPLLPASGIARAVASGKDLVFYSPHRRQLMADMRANNPDTDYENTDDVASEMLDCRDSVCQICWSKFNDPIVTACGHFFCERCVRHRYLRETTCFVCERELGGRIKIAQTVEKLLVRKAKREGKRPVGLSVGRKGEAET